MGWDAIEAAQGEVERALMTYRATSGNEALTPEQQVSARQDIAESLIEAKNALSHASADRKRLHREIERLEGSFKRKDEVKKSGDAYYVLDDAGVASGDPHCLACWEHGHQLIHLVRSNDGHACPICRHVFMAEQTPFALGT